MSMKGVNSVTIVGNMGQDPDVKFLASGSQITTLSVATTESWKDKKTGQPVEETEWHRIVLFGKPAEIAGQFTQKGSKVYCRGKNKTRKWTDSGGQDRWTTEVVVDFQGDFQILDSRIKSEPSQQPASPQQAQPQAAPQPAAQPVTPGDDGPPF